MDEFEYNHRLVAGCFLVLVLVLAIGLSMRPQPNDYASFYAGYIEKVPESEILPVLVKQLEEMESYWTQIPESVAAVIHSPYQWKIRQVICHLAEGERVFGYRLLRFARADQTPLSGWDELHYAMMSEEHPAPLADYVEEFVGLRRANLCMLRNLSKEAWLRSGTANGSHITVLALAYILAGHVRHHDAILRRRLNSSPG